MRSIVTSALSCLLLLNFLGCAGKNASQQQPETPSAHLTIDKSAILGIWWSPEMYQSAAFRITDSTMYYPDVFAEYNYELRGDTLFVYRDDGEISTLAIVKVTPDTLILLSWGEEQIYTRAETQEE